MSGLSATGPAPREHIQVIIRTRPTGNFAEKNLFLDPDGRRIEVYLPKTKDLMINNQQERWSFEFDQVMHNASQEGVFQRCAQDIVARVMEGYNGTIMAYGQTGAGKTHTMLGGAVGYKERGVIPRAISEVFQLVASRPDRAYRISVSYVEIYNELLFDLLDPACSQLSDLAIRENEMGAVDIKGLTKVTVENEEAALNLLFQGESNRSIAEHEMNKMSSRSHCIFSIYVEARSRVESSEHVLTSKLNLVDLAGSERVGRSGSTGAIVAEAKFINKSLSFLEQVVVALADRNREHVPFRQSKLTNVLRDSLGGNCYTRLIANISTEPKNLVETISTLRFASRVMKVVTKPVVNEYSDPVALVAKLQQQVRDLKQELAMHDTLRNRGGASAINYDSYTPEQQAEVAATVKAYCAGTISQIEVQSLRHTKEIFKQFKLLVLQLQQQLAVAQANSTSSATNAVPTAQTSALASTLDAANTHSSSIQSSQQPQSQSLQQSQVQSPALQQQPAQQSQPQSGQSAPAGKAQTAGRAAPSSVGRASLTQPAQGQQGANQSQQQSLQSTPADAPESRPTVPTTNVGQPDPSGLTFHLGIASSDAKPTSNADLLALRQNTPRIGQSLLLAAVAGNQPLASSSPSDSAPSSASSSASSAAVATEVPSLNFAQSATDFSKQLHMTQTHHVAGPIPSKEVVFKEFREQDETGRSLNETFESTKAEFLSKREKLVEIVNSLNEAKNAADAINERLAQKKLENMSRGVIYDLSQTSMLNSLKQNAGTEAFGSSVRIIDEEEYALLRELKALKEKHTEKAAARKSIQDEVNYLSQLMQRAKHNLAKAFMEYYNSRYGSAGNSLNSTGKFSITAALGSDTAVPGAADRLDQAEMFEKLERERLLEEDPDAIHFYNAQRNVFGVSKMSALTGTGTAILASGYTSKAQGIRNRQKKLSERVFQQ